MKQRGEREREKEKESYRDREIELGQVGPGQGVHGVASHARALEVWERGSERERHRETDIEREGNRRV